MRDQEPRLSIKGNFILILVDNAKRKVSCCASIVWEHTLWEIFVGV